MRPWVDPDGIDGKDPVDHVVEGDIAGPLKDCEAGSDSPCSVVGPSGLLIDCEGIGIDGIDGGPPANVCPLAGVVGPLTDGSDGDVDDLIGEGREGIGND